MRVVAVWLGLAGCLACGSTTRNPAEGMSSGGSAPIGGSASAGTGAGGEAGSEPTAELRIPPAPMRRLTPFEYQATVEDVLGVSRLAPELRGTEVRGYDNNESAQYVDVETLQSAFASAEDVARAVFSSAELRGRLPPCASAGCVADFVAAVSLRLFRRPASEAELLPHRGVYEAAIARGVTHEVALEYVLVSLLFGSQFLFRMEFSREGAAAEEPLDSYAVATRLSYLLWSSAPDDALLEAAAADALQDDAGLSAAFERLLADPRSRRFVESFAGQWLAFRKLDSFDVSTSSFPKWSVPLARELQAEGYAYFERFLRAAEPWPSFLRAPAPAPGPERAAAFAADGEPRLGFLSTPVWLMVSGTRRPTSPIRRGVLIRDRLLCQTLPPPPPDVPPDLGGLGSTREVIETIRREPRCAECHVLFDPLGVALEHYDLVGQYRTHDSSDGSVVNTVVEVPAGEHYPDGLRLTGLNDVSDYVATNPDWMKCLVEHLYTYGLGRVPERGVDLDNPALLAEDWQEGAPTLPAAIATLVQSKPFRFRSSGGAP